MLDEQISAKTFRFRDLPVFTGKRAAALNFFAAHEQPTIRPTGEMGLGLEFHPMHTPPRLVGYRVECSIGERKIKVLLEGDDLCALAVIGGYDVDLKALDGDGLALVVEHLLSDMLQGLEEQFSCSISITQASLFSGTLKNKYLCWKLACGEQNISAHIPFADIEREFGDLSDRLGERRKFSPGACPINVGFLGAQIAISADELAAIRINDVLLTEFETSNFGCFHLILAERPAAIMRRHEQGYQVVRLIGPDDLDQVKSGGHMSNNNEALDLSAVEVILSVEVDRGSVPLEKLQMLAPGSIVPFSSEKPEHVRLLANGKRVAEGELVMVDGKVGVRVLELQ